MRVFLIWDMATTCMTPLGFSGGSQETSTVLGFRALAITYLGGVPGATIKTCLLKTKLPHYFLYV